MIRGLKPLVCVAALLGSAALAQADTTVRCDTEDTFVVGWKSPITLTYSGGDTGQILVKSEHVAFTVPAHMTKDQTDMQGKTVDRITMMGTADTTSSMPEPTALNACITAELKPDQQTDADAQAVALLNCAGKVPLAQVPVTAHAMIMLLPITDPNKPEPIVQTSRKYVGARSPWGADITLETMPGGDCKIVD